MAESERIVPGEQRSFQVAAITHDVALFGCDSNPVLIQYEVDLSSGPTITLTQADICLTTYQIGQTLFDQQELMTSLDRLEKALACYQTLDDLPSAATVQNSIGLVYRALERYEDALAQYEMALVIWRQLDDTAGEGTTVFNVAAVYDAMGLYDEALLNFQEALSLLREAGDLQGQGTALYNIGLVYHQQGFYELAVTHYEEALSIKRRLSDRAGEGIMHNNIATTRQALGLFQEALTHYEAALAIARELNDRYSEGQILHNMGTLNQTYGHYQEALAQYEAALIIMRAEGDKTIEGNILTNLGGIHHDFGEYEAALANYELALAIYRAMDDRAFEGIALGNMGVTFQAQGRYEEALARFQAAIAILRDAGYYASLGKMFANIGSLYYAQGRHAEALENYTRALTMARSVEDRASEASTLNNIGVIYQAEGRHDVALRQYERARTIAREAGYPEIEADALHNMGAVLQGLERQEEAFASYEAALALSRSIGDRAGEGKTLSQLGTLHEQQGRDEAALESYEAALVINQAVGDRASEARTLERMGEFYATRGFQDDALTHYEAAMAVIESIRATAGTEQVRSSFISQYDLLYDRTIALYFERGQPAEAFRTSERSRARSFLDSLATGFVQLDDQELQQLIDQEQAAYRTRQLMQDALAQARAQQAADEQLIASLEADLAEAQEVYEAAVAAIVARDDRLNSLIPGRGLDYVLGVDGVQTALPADTTLVSYYLYTDQNDDQQAVALVVGRDQFKTVPLPVGEGTLQQALGNFRDFASVADAHPESLQQLYTWLIEPVAPYLTTSRLIIIPHGVLHYLPFAALTDGEQYLGERFVITTLPSASILPLLDESQVERDTPLVLGNPLGDADLGNLPAAEAEAQAVAALYGDTAYVGVAATETLVRTQAGRYGALHVAAHATFNQTAPLQSWLNLAPDGANDGRLHVDEVYGLDLTATDLVVLSACETSIEHDDALEVSPGDDIVALNRAFHFAGARNVIATLWEVADTSTAILMTRFYRYLDQGWGEAEALRQAQNDLRTEHPEYAHPYYWAAFVLSGDGGELTRPIPIAGVATETAAPMSTSLREPVASVTPSEARPGSGLCAGAALPWGLVFLVVQRRQRSLRK